MFTKRLTTIVLLLTLLPGTALASRFKDLAHIEGVRDNQLVGYGLVVGLNGTGDSAGTSFTIQSLVNMMERLGVKVDPGAVKVDNVAAVIVTAKLPPFARAGQTIDVNVSSIGDADSLVGGTLLLTPMKGPDGKVYAVAQGPLAVGSLAFGGKAAKVQKNHPTSGRIPGGALVEREVPFIFGNPSVLTYRFKDADFTTVSRARQVIDRHFGTAISRPLDGGTLQVRVPPKYRENTVEFVSILEMLEVAPDTPARIVVNEKTGTIVMGEDVRISTVAISHGNLNLVISETAQVSQPLPFGGGDTVITPESEIEVTEDKGNLVILERGVSIGEVAAALNAIGATPRDLIAIFQAVKAAGALHADLVIL